MPGAAGCRGAAGVLQGCCRVLPGAAGCCRVLCRAVKMCVHLRVLPGRCRVTAGFLGGP